MAGPVVSVALREPLSTAETYIIGGWLRSIGDVERWVQDADRDRLGAIAGWDLRVRDAAAIGLEPFPPADTLWGGTLPPVRPEEDFAHTCPVLVWVQRTRDHDGALYEHEDADVAQWVAQVGFFPDQVIGFAAMCNAPINHRILGHLALHLAERYDGIFDLNGAWYPPMDLDWLPESDPAMYWTKAGQQPYVYSGPGRIYELHYVTGRGPHWYANLADIEAFRARLQDPDFSLIK